jgi:hypothetical protein
MVNRKDHTVDKFGLIPRMQKWFNMSKSVNIIQIINRNKDKNCMVVSINALNAFYKIQHSLIIKRLKKLGIEGMFLNTVKLICDKPIADIILHSDKLKPFLLRSEMRQGCLLSLL